MPVEIRPLGSQGMKSPAQGYGCMGLSWAYAPAADEAAKVAEAAFDKCLELGVNHVDTAWIYFSAGVPHNEEMVGAAIKKHGRDKFIVGDKIGVDLACQPPFKQTPADLESQLTDALTRLGTDYLDIVYLNRPSPFIKIEDTMAVFKSWVESGKVKYVGLIEATAEDIRRAHAVCPLSAVQMEYSLFTRDIEAEIIPTCRELGIGIVAYSPLSRALLAGTVKSREQLSPTDYRSHAPRFTEENLKNNNDKVAAVEALAAKKGCTPAQIALAWLHSKGKDIFPIPGTRSPARIEENVKALDVKLEDAEVAELEAAVGEAAGERYGHGMMGTHNMRSKLAKEGKLA